MVEIRLMLIDAPIFKSQNSEEVDKCMYQYNYVWDFRICWPNSSHHLPSYLQQVWGLLFIRNPATNVFIFVQNAGSAYRRQTIQMWRVWQDIPYSDRATVTHGPSHRRQAFQVWHLWQRIHLGHHLQAPCYRALGSVWKWVICLFWAFCIFLPSLSTWLVQILCPVQTLCRT